MELHPHANASSSGYQSEKHYTQNSSSKLADAAHDSESIILKKSAFNLQNSHANAGANSNRMDARGTLGATDGQMHTEGSSCKKESWEAYIRWLSTAECGDDDDESQENHGNDGNAAGLMVSKPAELPTRDQESPESCGGKTAATDKKRKSRWEPLSNCEGDRPYVPKKRSGWSPEKPASAQSHFRDVKKLSLHMDPEFLDLKIKLAEINKKLRTGQVLDEKKPRRFRSPSPEPKYDNFGNRINSRENRAREKLNQERQLILDRLAKKGPPLITSLNRKLSTKVYFPPPQYPEYNPVGLLLGPQGLTQQGVEKETGAKLYIRGKATGKVLTPSTTHTEDEKLHVLIEADSDISLNTAASMVRKLLFPLGGGQELGQVASRANEMCHYCKQLGHYKNECPLKSRSSALKTHLATHLNGGNNEVLGLKTYKNNVRGSGLPTTKGGMPSGELGLSTIQTLPQIGVDSALNDDYDRTHVYIEHLPLSINESTLLSLFLRFGQITHADVFRNHSTGLSKGYGFVRFVKAADASRAVSVMDGYRLDDKVLEVKLKSSLQADASRAVSVMDVDRLDDKVLEGQLKTSSQVAANGSLSSSISQQKLQEELVVSSALHPHAGMPLSRAAQVSTPSSALQGMGPLAISSGLEAHVGASGFLPPNLNVQQSQKQPSPSSATQAGVSGSYLHYDYSPSQIQPFFSSATQRGVTGSYASSSYDYRLPSSATEAGFYRSGNGNIVQSQRQSIPSSATEAGFDQRQSLKQSIPSITPHASSASPPTGVSTRNGTTLPPANPFSLAANFFGRFMMAAAAAAASSTAPSHLPHNPDQQQLHMHSAMAGAIQDSRVAPPLVSPSSWNIATWPPPFNTLTGASNFFGGLPPPGPLQGHPRGHYAEQRFTTYHTHHGSGGQ